MEDFHSDGVSESQFHDDAVGSDGAEPLKSGLGADFVALGVEDSGVDFSKEERAILLLFIDHQNFHLEGEGRT